MAVSGETVFDDYEGMKDAYSTLDDLSNQYDSDLLDEAVSVMEDVVSEEPSSSVYQLIPMVSGRLSGARSEVDSDDRAEVSKIIQRLDGEVEAHPAQTEQRHYDSRRDQNNL